MVHIGSVYNVRIAGTRATEAAGQSKSVAAGHFRWLVGGALGAVVLVAAACGSSVATTTTTAAKSTASTVAATSRGSLGVILVDKSGRTLYRYSADGTGTPTCTGGCAATWPPLTVPAGSVHVTGAAGVRSADLGTVALPGGGLQVTFRGMPLYRFSGDTKPGDTNGQGTGGTWFVVPVAMVAPPPAAPSTTGVATTTTAPPPPPPSNRVTTAPPATAPPMTAPPATSPPVTAPPMTAPPATAPPVTAPPVTQPGGGGYGY
jgi:predicted lipoprotein with Yx(FWY)xxD motif